MQYVSGGCMRSSYWYLDTSVFLFWSTQGLPRVYLDME